MASTYLGAAPQYLMYGAAAGIGTRLLKNLFDVARRGSQTEVETLNLSEPAVTSVPMEVTEEEAEDLRRKGIKVKKILEKTPSVKTAELGAGAKIGLGATGAAAALAGWKFTDWLVDKARKSVVESDLDKLRKRVKRVIDDSPDDEDIPIHAYMKAAEDHYMKTAVSVDFGNAADKGIGALVPDPLLYGLGAIGVLGLVAAYNQVSEESKYKAKVKALKNYMKYKQTDTTTVTVDPVVIQRTPGSPAAQAEVNAGI